MVQKVFYGDATDSRLPVVVLPAGTRLMLMILVIVILVFGIFPQPMIDLTSDTVTKLIAQTK
jgi:NADH-quinone oxidoreductase subunit M